MGGETVLLPGATELEPIRQGEFDGMCGLYSIINAIRLVCYARRPLRPSQAETLFKRGSQLLAAEGKLSRAFQRGMREGTWMKLCESLFNEAGELLGTPIRYRRFLAPVSGTDFTGGLKRIQRRIDGGSPLLVLLWGRYNHCTVISGYAPGRLLLFDSWHFKWVTLATCELTQDQPVKRHQISRRSAAALSLDV